jgi:hypothetical protein
MIGHRSSEKVLLNDLRTMTFDQCSIALRALPQAIATTI